MPEFWFDPRAPSPEWEALQAATAPVWARLEAQHQAMAVEQRERELELARWEDDGGPTGPLPRTWRDACLEVVRDYGRKHGN